MGGTKEHELLLSPSVRPERHDSETGEESMVYREFARYYDSIYRAQGKDYEREACRLVRLIRRYGGAPEGRLLDVACGTGEHLRHLRAFYHVEGLDASEEMLALARTKLPGVPLHLGDMRSFDLGTRFHVVTCLFGSIGYVETPAGLEAAVTNMARHLAPGGVLVLEPWLGPGDIEDGRTHVAVAEEPDRKIVRVGVTRVRGRTSEVLFHFVVADREGIRHFEERHRLGLFTREEYEAAMRAAGLEVFYDEEGLTGRGAYVARAA